MNESDGLRRAYGRLLHAYPRWYRRERGLELLTTLLDDAAPGQLRPTRADVTHLLGDGLRTRLRPPRSAGAYAVATLLALWAALAGAAAAVLLTPYPGPPSVERAVAAAAVAVPTTPREVPGPVVRCDMTCPDSNGRDDVVAIDAPPDRTDRVVIDYALSGAEASAVVAQAGPQLAAAGWTVAAPRTQSDGVTSVEAGKDGLTMKVTGWPTSASPATVTIVVSKSFSVLTAVALAGGLLTGSLAGWLASCWWLQRRRRHSRALRTVTALASAPFLAYAALTVGQTALLTLFKAGDGFTANDVQIPEFILWTLPTLLPTAGIVVAVSIILASAVAALPESTHRPPPAGRATDPGIYPARP